MSLSQRLFDTFRESRGRASALEWQLVLGGPVDARWEPWRSQRELEEAQRPGET